MTGGVGPAGLGRRAERAYKPKTVPEPSMARRSARRTDGDLALVRRLVGENAREFGGRYAIVIAAMAVASVEQPEPL